MRLDEETEMSDFYCSPAHTRADAKPHGRVPRLDLADGDIARSTTGTGGGWGDPYDREPERVREDVLDGYVTVEGARADYGVVIDPHTADGIKVAREVREPGELVVCLETALAAKFEKTIHEAVGNEVAVPRPAALAGLEGLPQRVQVLPNDAAAVKQLIREALEA